MTVSRRSFLIGLLTSGCAAPKGPDEDQFGNPYPPECQGDLSYVDKSVVPVSPAKMEDFATALHVKPGERLYGLNGPVILIDDSLRGWKRDDIIRHERCHVIRGDWHR